MLTISTFNVQNDIGKYSKEKTNIILDYLKKSKIDVLSLQEVYSSLDRDLRKNLPIPYTSYGRYRFILRRILNRINEKTPIITNYKVNSYKTYALPFLPSFLKRVMTKVEIQDEDMTISVYNTHLDFQRDVVKKRQLNKILKIIKKDTNPIILMGDFNLKTNNTIFLDFIKELDDINIKHIDIKEKTLKISKYHRAIDHIFVSKEFEVKEKKLITDIPTSDHYPVLVKVKYEKKES